MSPPKNDESAQGDRNLFEESNSLENRCLDEKLLEQTLVAYSHAIAERNSMARQLRETLKQLSDLKFALERAVTISVGDERSIVRFLREQFSQSSRLNWQARTRSDELDTSSSIESILEQIVRAIARGQVWQGAIELETSEGRKLRYYTTVVPFSREPEQPHQFLALQVNLTDVESGK